jgi:hypothetical protein
VASGIAGDIVIRGREGSNIGQADVTHRTGVVYNENVIGASDHGRSNIYQIYTKDTIISLTGKISGLAGDRDVLFEGGKSGVNQTSGVHGDVSNGGGAVESARNSGITLGIVRSDRDAGSSERRARSQRNGEITRASDHRGLGIIDLNPDDAARLVAVGVRSTVLEGGRAIGEVLAGGQGGISSIFSLGIFNITSTTRSLVASVRLGDAAVTTCLTGLADSATVPVGRKRALKEVIGSDSNTRDGTRS